MKEPAIQVISEHYGFDARQNGSPFMNTRASKTPEPQTMTDDPSKPNNPLLNAASESPSEQISGLVSNGKIDDQDLEGPEQPESKPIHEETTQGTVSPKNISPNEDLDRTSEYNFTSIQEEIISNSPPTNPLSPEDSKATKEPEYAPVQEKDIPLSSPAKSPTREMAAVQTPQNPRTPASPRRSTRQSVRQVSKLRFSTTADELAHEFSPDENDAPKPIIRILRKRKAHQKPMPPDEELWRGLTEEERQSWDGWAEITSDPALFNYIIKGHGVKEVEMKEMFGFDDEQLNTLSKPVYGIIFLFKYREHEDETADLPKCPPNIWFANQIADNSCATIAMMNILMNVPDIYLGQGLKDFKASTTNKKPPWRGLHLKNNATIRVVHNSFIRRNELLNSDLYLQDESDKWEKTRKSQAKKRKATPKKKTAKQLAQEDEDAAFHYIAYVPINGEVWRMDGMQKNPINLGAYSKDWLHLARENIQIQMFTYPDVLEYNLLAMCHAPLTIIRNALASNAHAIQLVEAQLTTLTPDWRAFLPEPPEPSSQNQNGNENENEKENLTPSSPRDLLDSFSIHPSTILSAPLSIPIAHKLKVFADDTQGLMDLRESLIREQKRLQKEHCEEVMEDAEQADTAEVYKEDYGPEMYRLAYGMIEPGELEEKFGKKAMGEAS